MKNYDKYEKDGSLSYLRRIEKAIEIATVINYNENTIEFPGLFILSKNGKVSVVSKLLNPGVELFNIDSAAFEEILSLISEEKEGVRHLEKSITLPAMKSRVNITKMLEDNIYIRDFDNSLVVDDVLFTTSEIEFHGTGLFTARKHVYLVGMSTLSDLRRIFIQA